MFEMGWRYQEILRQTMTSFVFGGRPPIDLHSLTLRLREKSLDECLTIAETLLFDPELRGIRAGSLCEFLPLFFEALCFTTPCRRLEVRDVLFLVSSMLPVVNGQIDERIVISLGPFRDWLGVRKSANVPSDVNDANDVICDLCGTVIVGARLKCRVCPNYDHCSACADHWPAHNLMHEVDVIDVPATVVDVKRPATDHGAASRFSLREAFEIIALIWDCWNADVTLGFRSVHGFVSESEAHALLAAGGAGSILVRVSTTGGLAVDVKGRATQSISLSQLQERPLQQWLLEMTGVDILRSPGPLFPAGSVQVRSLDVPAVTVDWSRFPNVLATLLQVFAVQTAADVARLVRVNKLFCRLLTTHSAVNDMWRRLAFKRWVFVAATPLPIVWRDYFKQRDAHVKFGMSHAPAAPAPMSIATISNCLEWQFQCPRQFAKLQTTQNPKVRYCDVCDKGVHVCYNIEELGHHIKQSHCVAFVQTSSSASTSSPPMWKTVAGATSMGGMRMPQQRGPNPPFVFGQRPTNFKFGAGP